MSQKLARAAVGINTLLRESVIEPCDTKKVLLPPPEREIHSPHPMVAYILKRILSPEKVCTTNMYK
jgi:hypothetical protein